MYYAQHFRIYGAWARICELASAKRGYQARFHICGQNVAPATSASAHKGRICDGSLASASSHLRSKFRRCDYTRTQNFRFCLSPILVPILIRFNLGTPLEYTNKSRNIIRTNSGSKIMSNNTEITIHTPIRTLSFKLFNLQISCQNILNESGMTSNLAHKS